jgi:hypothetical protein
LDPADRPLWVDWNIRFGAIPDRLDEADHINPWFETRGSDVLLFKFPKVGRFLLEASGQAVLDPCPPLVEAEVRAVLLGSIFGAFVYIRGMLPLHASAVRFGAGAIAFIGHSGAGKSTMAAFLVERGYPLIADDVCVVDMVRADVPGVRPSFARLKLWGDSMDALGKPKRPADRDTARQEKYHLRLPAESAVLPLRALFVMEQKRSGVPELLPVTGGAAMTAVMQNIFRPEFTRCLGRNPHTFRQAAALAKMVPVFRLCRPRNFAQIDAVIELLEKPWDVETCVAKS